MHKILVVNGKKEDLMRLGKAIDQLGVSNVDESSRLEFEEFREIDGIRIKGHNVLHWNYSISLSKASFLMLSSLLVDRNKSRRAHSFL